MLRHSRNTLLGCKEPRWKGRDHGAKRRNPPHPRWEIVSFGFVVFPNDHPYLDLYGADNLGFVVLLDAFEPQIEQFLFVLTTPCEKQQDGLLNNLISVLKGIFNLAKLVRSANRQQNLMSELEFLDFQRLKTISFL